ncbi:unnamed protein product [Caenorhabditis auriculariae]|uniref:Uncharacterized protein n=1 Tax=Caenorhabditis auriculariae TaxID=2777116 RepID=A0A8S1HPZ7_9PELO|nr:unnamed protein product [Caenorhabditis auriculariae]
MSAGVKILIFLAVFAVAAARLHSITFSFDDEPSPIKTKPYDQAYNDKKRAENLKKLKDAGVSQPSIDKLDAVFLKYEEIYKKEPNLSQEEFEKKYSVDYYKDFSAVTDTLPEEDKKKVEGIFFPKTGGRRHKWIPSSY